MSIHIRRLNKDDLPLMEQMTAEKLKVTNDASGIFDIAGESTVFKFFVLPNNVHGSESMRSFGCFDKESKLIAIMGLRCLDNSPAWVFSFIVTASDCTNSIRVIKDLLRFAIDYQEKSGFFQWYVVSKLEKFDAWQKLFSRARDNYHHYVYARVPANTLPKWLGNLQLSGGKVFPYAINISMYMSKILCTSEGSTNFDERDIDFL